MVSAYAIYIFHVSVNIGEENFGGWLTIRQFFPYQNFPMYGINTTVHLDFEWQVLL